MTHDKFGFSMSRGNAHYHSYKIYPGASDQEEQVSATPAVVTSQVTRFSDDVMVDCENTLDAMTQWPMGTGDTPGAMDGPKGCEEEMVDRVTPAAVTSQV